MSKRFADHFFRGRIFATVLIICAPLIFGACGQDFNSNSNDKASGTSFDCSTDPSADFCAAVAVLQSKCINCHTNYHAAWGAYTSSQAYVNAGLVVAGSAATSLAIRRLQTYGDISPTMPIDDGALPVGEYNALVTWINGL